MSDEQLIVLAEVTLVGSLGVSLVLLFLIITLFFRKTEQVERRIATPGKQLDGVRKIWGNGPIGRWMRVLHVYAFFVYRNIPRVGKRIEARMGDEFEPLPLSLKVWATLPFTAYVLFVLAFFLSGCYLGLLES